MANLFKFTLVPDGLQVFKYSGYDNNDNLLNEVNCGIYTNVSTVFNQIDTEQFVMQDGNDAVVFRSYELVDIINDSPYFYFQNPAAIFEKLKGVLASSVTANQSLNLPITVDYLNEYGYSLDYSGCFYPTLNIIDYSGDINEVTVRFTLCKSINVHSIGINGSLNVTSSYFLESLTLPRYFSNVIAYNLPNLKEVYLYDGYALSPDSFDIDFSNCALSQESVDRILQACVNGGTSEKSLYLYGNNNEGANNAIPSQAGFDNIATLVSAGWTVFYND